MKKKILTDQSFGIVPLYRNGSHYEVLLVQHANGHGGHWAFPKGHKEGSENDIEAAKRELYEETGSHLLEIVDNVNLSEVYYLTRHGHRIKKTVRYFLGHVANKSLTLQPTEIQAAEWVPINQAHERLTFPGSRDILKNVRDYIAR